MLMDSSSRNLVCVGILDEAVAPCLAAESHACYARCLSEELAQSTNEGVGRFHQVNRW
ncbi:hypothetical protein ACP_2874 [Acidobacterium capsulatum ATCC 51196]|uniref:Uncharacterized protein n=1 Tax=Acidobacterium capsulatum (strain ATCC 51196 / DSM 11244 / BCRC 80197 / JCM 7670 / NBRC 15755 / NCIMB 13165 / 161) TaxID=240015 RepID=C1F3T4_ACIC5|nr:hypothetical protein ACP_2874 [Acidobacterium capsulatum ATCC 51196]